MPFSKDITKERILSQYGLKIFLSLHMFSFKFSFKFSNTMMLISPFFVIQ